jgi:hypothetical protein
MSSSTRAILRSFDLQTNARVIVLVYFSQLIGALAALAFLNFLMEASTALIISGLRKSKCSTHFLKI